MKRALVAIGALLALGLMLAVVGALLPVAHTAGVRLSLTAPPPAVYDAIADVTRYASWRSGLDSLRVVSAAPLRWREISRSGAIEFARTAAVPPRLVRAQIQGAEEQGFGGDWTWELAPAPAGGTVVTITEHGEIYNPLFRLLARYFFSPYSSLERYARDLAARFGETAIPERVTP